MDTFGFMAREVEDMKLIATTLGLTANEGISSPSAFSLSHCHFAMCKSPMWPSAGPGTAAAMELAAKILREAGAQVTDLTLPSTFDGLDSCVDTIMEKEASISFYGEYRYSTGQISEELAEMVENGLKHSHTQYLSSVDRISGARPQFDEIANGFTAVVTPSAVDEAPVGTGWTGDVSFNWIWTV